MLTGEAAVLEALRAHSRNSSSFLAFNDQTAHFLDTDGVVAYREAGRRHLCQFTGPYAADQGAALARFREWAAERKRRVCAVQLLRPEAELYAEQGFVVNQLGASFSIQLDGYTLKGGRLAETRNRISQAVRAGLVVTELDPGSARAAELDQVDRAWIRAKGRHVKPLTFMIGERGGRGAAHRRLFVARDAGRVVAYVSFSPSYGTRPGWLYDLTRRLGDAPTGAIELIVKTALETFRSEGAGWLHLGFTPFVQLADEHRLDRASPLVDRVFRRIGSHGARLYPALTQQRFKLKWAPQVVEPEYIAFERRITPAAVWQLLRLIGAV